jgi:hypothetical protein
MSVEPERTIVDDWELIERNGRVELWHNRRSGNWGVYLYEHVQQDEPHLLWGLRATKAAAREIFDAVIDLVS